jgi:hypothetical protein
MMLENAGNYIMRRFIIRAVNPVEAKFMNVIRKA